ncbi:MAG: YkgJ family cysteine cluster protein [Verrucomicrobiota bacterium]|nr:YkgJ family cysteine cluster protein [Verrucomicrobiota bacterium]
MPIFYECDRCSACCRWPGEVRISAEEITRIASHLNLTEHDFIQQHTRLSSNRQGLALADKENGECAFLEAGSCAIQEVKPQQCREFPNLWNFPGFEKICKAVPRQVDEATYRELIFKATGRRINGPDAVDAPP